jgi:hypothetical protein
MGPADRSGIPEPVVTDAMERLGWRLSMRLPHEIQPVGGRYFRAVGEGFAGTVSFSLVGASSPVLTTEVGLTHPATERILLELTGRGIGATLSKFVSVGGDVNVATLLGGDASAERSWGTVADAAAGEAMVFARPRASVEAYIAKVAVTPEMRDSEPLVIPVVLAVSGRWDEAQAALEEYDNAGRYADVPAIAAALRRRVRERVPSPPPGEFDLQREPGAAPRRAPSEIAKAALERVSCDRRRWRAVRAVWEMGLTTESERREALVSELARHGVDENPFWAQRWLEHETAQDARRANAWGHLARQVTSAVRFLRSGLDSGADALPIDSSGEWLAVTLRPGAERQLDQLYDRSPRPLGDSAFFSARIVSEKATVGVQVGERLLGEVPDRSPAPQKASGVGADDPAGHVACRLTKGWRPHQYLLEVRLPRP